jgi:hypothetical protein
MAPEPREGRGAFCLSPMMYFTFLHAGRHFWNFPEIYPVKKRKIVTVSREGSNSCL